MVKWVRMTFAIASGLWLAGVALCAHAQNPAKQCHGEWLATEPPSAALTESCIEYLLREGYGRRVDAEALTLDPSVRGRLAESLTMKQLSAMSDRVTHHCAAAMESEPEEGGVGEFANPKAAFAYWRCVRALEVLSREASHQRDLSDDIALHPPAQVLESLLAGQPISIEDLIQFPKGEGPCYTKLNLLRFRNAVYARHGLRFKNVSLQQFFYAERPDGVSTYEGQRMDILPLPEGTKDKVKLEPVDHRNLAVISKAQKRCASYR